MPSSPASSLLEPPFTSYRWKKGPGVSWGGHLTLTLSKLCTLPHGEKAGELPVRTGRSLWVWS